MRCAAERIRENEFYRVSTEGRGEATVKVKHPY
jgi:hypothetical protein